MAVAALATAAVVGTAASIRSANKASGQAASAQRNAEEIANRELAIAEEQWNIYKQNYLPLEQEYLDVAKNYGSQANQEVAAQRAAADVTSAFAGAREQLNRAPAADPNSQQYAKETSRIALQEAASSAAAQTDARDRVRAAGVDMLASAAGKAPGVASAATGAMRGAGAAFGGLYQNAMSASNQANANVGGAFQAMGGLAKAGAFDGVKNWWNNFSTPTVVSASGGMGTTAGMNTMGMNMATPTNYSMFG